MYENIEIISAISQLRKLEMVKLKLNDKLDSIFSDSHIFAVVNSIYPLFQEDPGEYEYRYGRDSAEFKRKLPFFNTYLVGYDTVLMVATYLDKCWLDEKVPTYRDLEYRYGYRTKDSEWKGRDIRGDLTDICRYLFIDGRFDPEFWDKIMSGGPPMEASGITRKFSMEEILRSVLV